MNTRSAAGLIHEALMSLPESLASELAALDPAAGRSVYDRATRRLHGLTKRDGFGIIATDAARIAYQSLSDYKVSAAR